MPFVQGELDNSVAFTVPEVDICSSLAQQLHGFEFAGDGGHYHRSVLVFLALVVDLFGILIKDLIDLVTITILGCGEEWTADAKVRVAGLASLGGLGDVGWAVLVHSGRHDEERI